MRVSLFLHIVSNIVWIGGMFLAYMAVRPAAAEVLDPPQRLRLWSVILGRFFPWVWAAVVIILITGFVMMGQMNGVPRYVMAMALIGIVMTVIFVYIYFVPFAGLKAAVGAENWKAGGAALARIRTLVGLNLVLGLLNVAIAGLGPIA